ncbi:MAG: thiosulfate sulfurtransferase [Robiginitomaculum sp.]|nr:MAG: thiosulfate sulfurtransferase [Robiginitomaculum sp.]
MKPQFLPLVLVLLLGALPACSQEPTSQSTPQNQSEKQQSLRVTHISAVQANTIMKERPNLVILDVRTATEFSSGHIEGAINIDVKSADFATRLTSLDPNQDYLIHCHSGARSTRSLASFETLGFKHILHMDGGIKAWNKANLPTKP